MLNASARRFPDDRQHFSVIRTSHPLSTAAIEANQLRQLVFCST